MISNASLVLQIQVPDFITNTIADAVAFVPALIGALLVLAVGGIVGRVVAGLVRRLAEAVELDERMAGSPVKTVIGEGERAGSNALATIAAWYVYLLAILAAANVLAIDVLSTWVADVVSYLPAFVAGVLLILVGFLVADFLADAIGRTEALTSARFTSAFADGIRYFLYFIVIVMGLDTMGVGVDILFLFAQAAALGLAVGIALAIGIAFGWGGKDYVGENIGTWTSRAPVRTERTERTEPTGSPQADGGNDAD